VQTYDPKEAKYISAAPRVGGGLVLIGNAGDIGKVRGFVTAYDAETGKLAWRFYTVPGDPAKGFENDAMRRAAQTWAGEWWKFGGGGSVWNSIAYDPDMNLFFIGTGNGYPGTTGSAARARATTCSCVRSSRWMPRRVDTAGITRSIRPRPGTTTPRWTCSSPKSTSRASVARS
jgi:glucose dehydrogenase